MQRICLILMLCLWMSGCAFLQNLIPNSTQSISVNRGDTLYSIAKRYDVPLRDLIERNNLTPPYTLRVGQILHLPANNYHVVAKGDTLYNISRRYDVNVNTLAQANGLQAPYTLIIGQRLAVSGNAKPQNYANYGNHPKPTPTYSSTTKQPAQSSYIAKNRKSKFIWPVRGNIISKYGTIGKGRTNDGINIKAAKGTSVKAADIGTVAYAGSELKGFGNLILIRHNDGWITAYAHNEKLLVKKGQKVLKGEKIATVGATGGVSEPQLHFEIRSGKNAVNPIYYLQ